MKKIFVYRIEKNDWYSTLKIYIYELIGYKVFVWGEHGFLSCAYENMTFPSAIKSVEYEPIARKKMAKYFTHFSNSWSKDIYRRDYIAKTIDISLLDYYAFEETTRLSRSVEDQVKLVTPLIYQAISECKKSKVDISPIISYPFLLMRLTIRFLKDLYRCLIFKSKTPVPDIIYYRKKVSPDLGEYPRLRKKLNIRGDDLLIGVYPISSSVESKFGCHYLNSFNGMSGNLIKAYFFTMKKSFFDLGFFYKNGINKKIFRKYLIDTYISNIFSRMEPKVICGVLVDKPLYVLFYKYKSLTTKIVSLNESFFFPPNRSFDYNHLDRYYAMNNIDEKMQNIHGGSIKSFKHVEFFRNVPDRVNGISEELEEELKKYKHCILLLPAQTFVEKTGFYYWASDELESFLKVSLDLSISMPDTLFIVKGKKGELRFLPNWFHELDQQNENIFVIHCDRPKELEKNRFEDLVSVADISISMALTSTTIWQTIARGKPVIAINRSMHESSLTKYKGFESNLTNLYSNIMYWKSLSNFEISESIKIIKKDFNIGKSDGLSEVALDLKKLIS